MADEEQKLTDLYSDEPAKKTAEQRKEAKRIRDRYVADVRKILLTPEGRRVFWHLLSTAGVFRSSFSANALQTAFNEGRRDMGLAILADVNKADSDSYPRMQREYWSEKNKKTEAE